MTHKLRKMLQIAGGVALLAIAVGFGYVYGHYKGMRHQVSTFVVTLHAIEQLRDGNAPEALDTLESQCFASAVMVLEEPLLRNGFAVQNVLPDLRRYREKYRPQEDWSPMEIRLDALLSEKHPK